ncbi:hypothetical protein BgiBS90_023252, partial [Biomphalaria glabrata]
STGQALPTVKALSPSTSRTGLTERLSNGADDCDKSLSNQRGANANSETVTMLAESSSVIVSLIGSDGKGEGRELICFERV